MDRSYCERLAREALAHWVEELPLEEFRILLKVENLDDSDATVDMLPEYRDATIRVDDDKMTSARKVASSVKHEMMHILTVEFQMFWDAVEDDIREEARGMAKKIFHQCWELVVRRLERCWPEEE